MKKTKASLQASPTLTLPRHALRALVFSLFPPLRRLPRRLQKAMHVGWLKIAFLNPVETQRNYAVVNHLLGLFF